MRAGRIAALVTFGLLGGAFPGLVSVDRAHGQSVAQPPGQSDRAAPGDTVAPQPRGQPSPLVPEARERSPATEVPESRRAPEMPQGGGCRYHERPLELIV